MVKLSVCLLFPALLLCQQTPPVQDKDKASLEGVVTNAITGEPLRKVRLMLKMSASIEPAGGRQTIQPPETTPAPVVSDVAGKFVFLNLDPGNYLLTARRDGFQDMQYGTRNTSRIADLILLHAGDRKTSFSVKMTPFGAIAGRLVDEDGDPVQNIQVAALRYRYTNTGRQLEDIRNAESDDLGNYRLFNLSPGKYYLKASPQQMRVSRDSGDSESFAPVYFPGAPDATNATQVEISAGKQLTGMNLQMRRARFATLRGRIIAPPGAGITVGLMVVSGGGTSTSTTNVDDKDGKFELFGVGPGDIYILGEYSLNGQRFSAQVPLQVGSADINGIEIRPAAAMELSGQVRIEGTSTEKPSIARVTLQGPGRSYGSETGTVKDDGSMLLHNVQPNVYKVTVGGLRNLYLKSVHWGVTDITDASLDLTAGIPPRTELSVVLGSDAGEIQGVVKNANGDPMDSATVTLIPTGSHPYSFLFKSTTTSGNGGKFTIGPIAPGPYRVFAWDKVDPNQVRFDPDFLKPYDASGKNIVIQPNDKQTLELKMTVVNQ